MNDTLNGNFFFKKITFFKIFRTISERKVTKITHYNERYHVLPLNLLSSVDNFLLVNSDCPKEGKLSTIFDRRAAGWTYGHMVTKISWMDI